MDGNVTFAHSLQFPDGPVPSNHASNPPTRAPLVATTHALQPLPDLRKLRIRATVAYAIGCLLSVVWGMSADFFLDNELGASASLQATADGNTFLLVANEADFAWQDVRLEVDDRWFYRLPSVPPGGQVDARLADFLNEYTLPRPRGMFYWERVGAPIDPDRAPADLRPNRVVIASRQGEVRILLGR